ncbi:MULTISPECIES: AAA family ATPase [unclassified Methylobacterium]|uniref:AAA family ATPase n=2 Tax=Bacteria TaxID=2 RepID=UPI0037035890
MAFRDMSRRDRLLEIGRFHSDTPAFLEAKELLTTLHGDWRTGAEGSVVFVVGENGAGKSTVADDYMSDVAAETGGTFYRGEAVEGPDGEELPRSWCVLVQTDKGFERPAVKLEIGPRPSFNSLLSDYLLLLGYRARAKATFGQLISLAVRHSLKQKVRVLVADESQEILWQAGSENGAKLFRHLLNLARVQIVLMGELDALNIPEVNGAVRRRTTARHVIRPFDCTPDDQASPFMAFSRDAESILPFDRPTGLDSPLTALRMHIACGGYPGVYVPFLKNAAGNAIKLDLDSITTKVFADTYRSQFGAEDGENPFLAEDPDPMRFTAMAKRRKARLEREEGRDGKPPPGDRSPRWSDMDFTK